VIDFDPKQIDFNRIHNLLSNLSISPTALSENEVKERGGLLSDKEVLAQYGVSLNL
jgi:hypothetical protein